MRWKNSSGVLSSPRTSGQASNQTLLQSLNTGLLNVTRGSLQVCTLPWSDLQQTRLVALLLSCLLQVAAQADGDGHRPTAALLQLSPPLELKTDCALVTFTLPTQQHLLTCHSVNFLLSCSSQTHAEHPTGSSPCHHCGWKWRLAPAPDPWG